jgi:hypothetical protein
MKVSSSLMMVLIVSPIIFLALSYSPQRSLWIKNYRRIPSSTRRYENRDQTLEKIKSVSSGNIKQISSSRQDGIIVIAGFESFNIQLYRDVAFEVT